MARLIERAPLATVVAFTITVTSMGVVLACASVARENGGAMAEAPAAETSAPALDLHEVTVADYRECVEARGCVEPSGEWALCNGGAVREKSNHPINCVTWREADAYCRWAKRRLPTEAEWRAALQSDPALVARLGGADLGDVACWNGDSGDMGTCDVDAHPDGATSDGIFGLAGNVWEWTATRVERPGSDGKPDYSIVGGGWEHDDLGPPELGLDAREARGEDHIATDLGFRCHAP